MGLGKQIAAILFVIALLTQTFSRWFVIADYYANTGKYAAYCVNKAKPKLQCNGKCQMMKKLQEEEKKDHEDSGRKSVSKNEVVLSSKSFFASAPHYSIPFTNRIYVTLPTPGVTDRSLEVFHPPSHFMAA